MNALIVVGTRVALTPDGRAWTRKGTLGWAFWARYLEVYDRIRVLVRAQEADRAPPDWTEVTGDRIAVEPLPDFPSFGSLLRRFPAVARAASRALQTKDAIHMRIPAIACDVVERSLHGRPYGVEVVGDPWDVYSKGSMRHPLRPAMRRWASRRQRVQCAGACAAAYVTREHLQLRYPPAAGVFTTHFSSIQLGEEAYVSRPRKAAGEGPLRLITVGTWEALYKAPDVLIDAVASLVAAGRDLSLEIVGDGAYRAELERRAAERGLGDRVCFPGAMAGPAEVRSRLDDADLFVLPSRQEGLPRAMIEAMARGLPCIGSDVGGIPELIDEEHRVPANDADALAAVIGRVAADPAERDAMAERNLRRAQEYRDSVLRERRNRFYSEVLECTRRWNAMGTDL